MCQITHCHADADGTLWCEHQSVDCCAAAEMSCAREVLCGCEAAAGEAAAPCTTPCGQPATLTVRQRPLREPFPEKTFRGPEGALPGAGAFGGQFESSNFWSTTRDWYMSPQLY